MEDDAQQQGESPHGIEVIQSGVGGRGTEKKRRLWQKIKAKD